MVRFIYSRSISTPRSNYKEFLVTQRPGNKSLKNSFVWFSLSMCSFPVYLDDLQYCPQLQT